VVSAGGSEPLPHVSGAAATLLDAVGDGVWTFAEELDARRRG
jgi:hypothetical protein